MELREVKTHLEYFKSLKKRNEISEFGENLLKELETLLEQREKMLEMLKELREELLEFQGWTNECNKIEQLIKESTEI
jgi:hypothetical protein